MTRLRSGAADMATFLPVSMEPVKLTLRGTGWPVIQAPSSSPPLTTLSTPGGITSRSSSTTFRVVRGVKGDGLRTRVLPASRAGAIFQKARMSGKFHGVMAATTPTGRRTTSTRASASSWMTWGGVSRLAKYWHQMAAAKTSMLASASGLPCSAVRIGASSAAEASSTSAIFSRVGPPDGLVGLPVPLGLGGGVEGRVELLAGALRGVGEDLAVGRVDHAERLGRRNRVPPDGHDEVGHVLPPMLGGPV